MTRDTYSDEDFFLFNLPPDWDSPVSLEATLLSQTDVGLTNREARRPHSETLRCRFRFTITAEGADARSLVAALRSQTNEPVAVPLWPAKVRWADRATRAIGGGLNIVFREDWTEWEIYEDVEPDWPLDTDWIAPLLWGRLTNRKTEWLRDDVLIFQMDLEEASPANWAVLPAEASFAAGPFPSGSWITAPRLLPFQANFDRIQSQFAVTILRQTIGFGRETANTEYPQTVARGHEAEHCLKAADMGLLLRFFLEHGGGSAFWVPENVSAAPLTSAAGAGATTLNVSDTDAITVGDWIAVLDPGGLVDTTRVTAKTSTTLTVSAVGPALGVGTLVAQLLLCRLAAPRLQLTWRSGDYAEAGMRFIELPPEYTPASGETLGTTLGLLAKRCFLYELTRSLNGTDYVERLTSFESDVDFDDETWTAAKISHGSIRQGTRLDADEVELTADLASSTSLTLMATLRLEAPLILTIRAADVADGTASNEAILFQGEITAIRVKGSILTGRAVIGGSLLDRQVPRFRISPTCNHALFSIGCGLTQSDWKFTAAVDDPGTPGYPFQIVLKDLDRVTGSDPTFSANWFAGGYAEFGSGDSFQRRPILLSTNPSGGGLTITLDRDPYPFPEEDDAVVLYPGCDLTAGTCQDKFDNYLNFGGHPLVPVSNPGASVVMKPTGGGKK